MGEKGNVPEFVPRVAVFATSHGFGHAARVSAIMSSLLEASGKIHFDIYTTVPEWFFGQALHGSFTCHTLVNDIGLVQKSPLEEDLQATLERLDEFYPLGNGIVEKAAGELNKCACSLVLCDISPLGIAAARAAGVPSVLVENFTWDWIYRGYVDAQPRFEKHASTLEKLFSQADYHIQAEPVCRSVPADLTVGPISRRPRRPGEQIRRDLGIPSNAMTALVTMGGIPLTRAFLGQAAEPSNFHLIIPGIGDAVERRGNLVLLPHRSGFFHPDLIGASDAVVGKVGYSTLAEIYHAGVPYGFIGRRGFRESFALENFVKREMEGVEIFEKDFLGGSWRDQLPDLFDLPRRQSVRPNGADQAAAFIYDLLR